MRSSSEQSDAKVARILLVAGGQRGMTHRLIKATL